MCVVLVKIIYFIMSINLFLWIIIYYGYNNYSFSLNIFNKILHVVFVCDIVMVQNYMGMIL